MFSMDLTTFLILNLATWRVSSLLVNEGGPGDIFTRLRFLIGVQFDEQSERIATNIVAGVFNCIWCMSFWIAVVVAIGFMVTPKHTVLACLPFALSAGAIAKEIFRLKP